MSANNLFSTKPNVLSSQASTQSQSGLQKMQQGFQDGLEFQNWVSEQAQVLGRLKVFHTMAKSINDQQ